MRIIKLLYKHSKILIVIIAVIVFLGVSSALQLFTNAYSPNYIAPDSYTYITASTLLFNGLDPHPTRPMGYSALAGLPNLVFSKPTLSQMISWNYFLNFNLWIITVWVLFVTLSLNLNNKSAFSITVLFIFCIGNIGLVSNILTETLTCCLITLIGCQLLYFYKKKGVMHFVYSVSIINFLVLVRPGVIYLALFFNLLFIVYIIRYKVLLSIKLILPVALTVSTIIIQASLMYKVHGNFTVSYIDKVTWYLYLGGQSSANEKHISFPAQERALRNNSINILSYKDRYELANMDLKNQLKNHPNLILSNFINNIFDNIIVGNLHITKAENYYNVPYFNYIKYYLYLLSKGQNIIFSFLGFFLIPLFLIRYRLLSLPLIMSCIIIWYILFSSGISFWQGDRFHIVFYPLLLIVLSYILAGHKWFKKNELL